MEKWLRSVAVVLTPLIAIVPLIVSIRASQCVKRERDSEILLAENRREANEWQERIDREAAKREEEFDAQMARSDALARQ